MYDLYEFFEKGICHKCICQKGICQKCICQKCIMINKNKQPTANTVAIFPSL